MITVYLNETIQSYLLKTLWIWSNQTKPKSWKLEFRNSKCSESQTYEKLDKKKIIFGYNYRHIVDNNTRG